MSRPTGPLTVLPSDVGPIGSTAMWRPVTLTGSVRSPLSPICLLLAVIGLLAAPAGVLTGWAVAPVLLGPLAATITLAAHHPGHAAPAGAQTTAARIAAVRG